MYDSVMVPTDGSDGAAEALEHAIGAAESYDASLHVVSVVDHRVVLAAEAEAKDDVREELTVDATEAVDALAERARETNLDPTTATPEGVPHREILEYADREGIDLLVLGTHGRSGREKRLNLGSTTERVVKAADRPVLVVDIG